jgi:hypothetical protein
MNIFTLKNIMKEVNAPNEYTLSPHNLAHSLYWIWKVEGVRLKTLDSRLVKLRKPASRFDVFINGLFIRTEDYRFRQVGNDFYIDFIRANFPTTIENVGDPNFGDPYVIEESDVVKIKGDLESING